MVGWRSGRVVGAFRIGLTAAVKVASEQWSVVAQPVGVMYWTSGGWVPMSCAAERS